MKRSPYSGIRIRTAAVAVLLVALLAVSASAQYQTGNIYGRTMSKDGAVLPGVTVTLSGVGAPQNAVSDGQGNFRFLNLSPGTYSLKAELAGFGGANRSGVNVRVGASADVELVLNPSVAESITVTAEAPLLDVRKTGTGATIDKVEMDKIPTARDPWMILQSTPGVLVDRINVGGTQSGQQSIYISKGAPRNDGTWNIDGVNITDMGATGSSPTYYDFDMFEELQITTGGSDPRIQTSGVQMNMVTKRGTNDYRGSGRYLYAPGSSSAEATVPSEATSYLVRANSVNYVRDYGAELGGPLWRDKAWLWIARGDQKISTWQSQGRDAQGNPAFIIPDDTILRNKNLKLNAQPFESNSFVASYTFGDKFRNARDLSPTRPFDSSWKQTGPTKVYKLEDTQLIGQNLYLTGMWSKVDGGFGLFANGGQGADSKPYWQDSTGVFRDSYFTYQTVRPQKQYRLDGSQFLDVFNVNHELKFGFGYRDTPVSSITTYPGASGGFWRFDLTNATSCGNLGLAANCGVATLVRFPQANYSGKYKELYLGDTIMMGSLTLQFGLRWDDQESQILAMDINPNPVLANSFTVACAPNACAGGVTSIATRLPGLDYPGQSEALKWRSISPRLGATWALGADKKTLLRAAYNRYVSQMGSTVASSSPVGTSQITYFGEDANGDRLITQNELKFYRSSAGINLNNPTAVASTRRIDYDMNPPTTDEITFGVDRELLTNFAVGVTLTHRRNKDLAAIRWEKTQGSNDFFTAADYVPYIRNGQQVMAGGKVPVYALVGTAPTPTFSVITNRPDYSQTYNGVELTATKRMSRNWMMRFNASYNDYTDDCGEDASANPTPGLPSTGIVNGQAVFGGPAPCAGGQFAPQSAGSGAFGNVFVNSKWNFNLNGVYVFPWNISVGGNLMARQGYPSVYRDRITGIRGGDMDVVLDPIGSRRFDNVYQLDLRLAKEFRFLSRVGITVSGEVFNATNERTVLQRETIALQDGAPRAIGNRITELQAPRVFRIGAKFNF